MSRLSLAWGRILVKVKGQVQLPGKGLNGVLSNRDIVRINIKSIRYGLIVVPM